MTAAFYDFFSMTAIGTNGIRRIFIKAQYFKFPSPIIILFIYLPYTCPIYMHSWAAASALTLDASAAGPITHMTRLGCLHACWHAPPPYPLRTSLCWQLARPPPLTMHVGMP